ncbi:hypothetical protein JOE21_002156 [Desmospora profundinema]|uniref:Uncharacterized protein n=1 Tax=Desmospora profundinema TaxID=1571184 RepID=A0ABU1IQY1_9BACL|nr:hypothetical protein [Desmospora profundinema]
MDWIYFFSVFGFGLFLYALLDFFFGDGSSVSFLLSLLAIHFIYNGTVKD